MTLEHSPQDLTGQSYDSGLIAENYREIRRRVEAACARAKRDPKEITVIGVTKTKPAGVIRAAAKAGIVEIGENYVQELVAKQRELGDLVRWHYIGHLQRNKVREILPFIHTIQSVDSERLAEEINRQAMKLGRRITILLQVNSSGEESKFGVEPEDAEALARHLATLPGVQLAGLMTIPAIFDDPQGVRPMFQLLHSLRRNIEEATGLRLPHLSMGMTGDFEVAIEEGATMIRIGTALFGGRS